MIGSAMKPAIVSGPSSWITSSSEPRVRGAERLGPAGERAAGTGPGVWRWMNPPGSGSYGARQPGQPPAARAWPVAAVVGAVVRQDLVLGRPPRLLVVLAGHLDRRLGHLGAAGQELHRRVLGRRDVEQELDQLERAVAGAERRGRQGQPLDLPGGRLGQALVPVAKVDAEGSRQAVDEAPAVHVDDVDALALGQDQRVLGELLHRQEVDHDVASELFHRVSLWAARTWQRSRPRREHGPIVPTEPAGRQSRRVAVLDATGPAAGPVAGRARSAGGRGGGAIHPHPLTQTTWRSVWTISTRSRCAAMTASIGL